MRHGKMKKLIFAIALAGMILGLAVEAYTHFNRNKPIPSAAVSQARTPETVKHRVLFVNSYHEGYPWSDGIVDGTIAALKIHRLKDGQLDCSGSRVILRVCYMDTKRHGTEEFKRKAGAKVQEIIKSWKPDLVMGSDDNFVADVVVPYCCDSRIPVVFCGVNWDASEYKLPRRNVTGMLEVAYIPKLMEALRPYAHGNRIGLLGARNETNEKEARFYAKSAGVKIEQLALVDTFEQWKKAYVALQNQVDMLILLPPSFIQTPQEQSLARQFVWENTKIPSGSVEEWIAPYSLICQAKLGSEQGEWAAMAVLRILGGVSPADIPFGTNYRTQVILNMPLAKKLGIMFPVNLIEQSLLVNEE